jgi:hypothetical protein
LLGALTAFSIAMALGNGTTDSARAAGVGRAALPHGTALRFTSPFLSVGQDPLFPLGGDAAEDPDGFDLGDVVVGQAFSRLLTACGGFKPYKFSSSNLSSSLAALESGGTASDNVKLETGGLLLGVIPMVSAFNFNPSADLYAPLYFGVTLTDTYGSGRKSSRSGIFRLTVYRSTDAIFRHAMDKLPVAQHGRVYMAKLDLIGGQAPYRWSLKPGSIFLNGVAKPKLNGLETYGLTLSADGILYGRPLVTGYVGFTLCAEDAAGNTAKDRAGTVDHQYMAVKIEAESYFSSELTTLSCSVRGDKSKTNADGFSCRGLVDLKDARLPQLAGKECELRIGGATYGAFFNDRGVAQTQSAAGVKINIRLNNKGAIAVRASGLTLYDALNLADVSGAEINLIWGLTINGLTLVDVLPMKGKANLRWHFQYFMGKTGGPSAGSFQIVNVRGAERKNFKLEPASRWLVRCLGIPPLVGETRPTWSDGSVTVRMGLTYSQSVSVALERKRLIYKAASSSEDIYKLFIDPQKFVHRLETNFLTPLETNVPQAAESRDPDLFIFGLDAGSGSNAISGLGGCVIYPRLGTWSEAR